MNMSTNRGRRRIRPAFIWPAETGLFRQFQYLTVPLQFTRPADQQAAAIIPASLDGLRKKERLRELYRQSPAADLEDLAASLGPAAGLDHQTALAWLAELAASG